MENKVRRTSTEHKNESEMATFRLLQSLASETVDIVNILKLIDEEMDILDLSLPKDQSLLMLFGHVISYFKQVCHSQPMY